MHKNETVLTFFQICLNLHKLISCLGIVWQAMLFSNMITGAVKVWDMCWMNPLHCNLWVFGLIMLIDLDKCLMIYGHPVISIIKPRDFGEMTQFWLWIQDCCHGVYVFFRLIGGTVVMLKLLMSISQIISDLYFLFNSFALEFIHRELNVIKQCIIYIKDLMDSWLFQLREWSCHDIEWGQEITEIF